MNENTNFSKTLLITGLFSLAGILVAFALQYQANQAVRSCSYLDPISVDIWAMLFAVFLIGEGFSDIFRSKHYPLKNQLTKSIRVAVGFSILTIHLIQIAHK